VGVSTDLSNGQTMGRMDLTGGIKQDIGDVELNVTGSIREQKNFQTGVEGSGFAAQGSLKIPTGPGSSVNVFGGVSTGVSLDPTLGTLPIINPAGAPAGSSTTIGVTWQQKL
jgi:hypothetical protein